MRLLNERTGELFPGRCKCTNLCRYCQMLYVVETVEMLTLDALEHQPTMWAVLTAREHLTRAQCTDHLRKLRLHLKRRWPMIEWFVQVEFQRRGAIHLNLLIKGVPKEDMRALYEAMTKRWCDRVDAIAGPFEHQRRGGQSLQEISQADGLVRYLNKTLSHGLKQEQAPPMGWRGHRTSQTRGYLVRPASVMREEAKASIRHKRELRRQLQAGLTGHDAELAVHEALAFAAETTWRMVQILPTASGDGEKPSAQMRRVMLAKRAIPPDEPSTSVHHESGHHEPEPSPSRSEAQAPDSGSRSARPAGQR